MNIKIDFKHRILAGVKPGDYFLLIGSDGEIDVKNIFVLGQGTHLQETPHERPIVLVMVTDDSERSNLGHVFYVEGTTRVMPMQVNGELNFEPK